MSQEGNQNVNQTDQAPAQAEKGQEGGSQSKPNVPTSISSLNNYRAKQQQKAAQNHFGQAGSPSQSESGQSEGATEPNVGESQTQQQDGREQWIPRDRFDQVIQQKQQLEQQFQQAQQAQQFQQQVTGMQGQPQQPQPQPNQVQGPTGMMHNVPQQQQSQQQQPEIPNFDDPEVQKEWKRKINNDPINGLREFMRYMVQAEGQPLLQQYVQQINSQLSPLQRAFVNQQVQQYSQQKSDDPQFQQIAPTFNQLVNTAQQRGYDVTNPQVLQTIEFVARQQSGLPPQGQAQGQQAEPMPFSERPGNSGANLGRSQQYRQLSPQEQRVAQRFGQTPQQYLDSLRAMGVE